MLGDLARWLRILGEDCSYASPTWHDDEVIAACQPEDRVLLTRDHKLVGRARNQALRVVEVPRVPMERVLVHVYHALRLMPDPARLTRICSHCNGRLAEVSVDEATDRAKRHGKEPPPEGAHAGFDRFWSCTRCGQPFWRGSHWPPLLRMFEEVLARLHPLAEREGWAPERGAAW